MKFLKPNSVSGEILNLLDEANERVILVSPYCKFDKWYRLVNKIKDLKNRNVALEFYVREGEIDTYEQVKNIGIEPVCIPNLHSKLYLNEKYGIITSMNLLLSSEINSLEIGYKTETPQEYNELLDFYSTYLNKKPKEIVKEVPFNWVKLLENKLSEKLDNIRIFVHKRYFNITTLSNSYTLFINNDRNINKVSITGIISCEEYEYLKSIEKKIIIKDITIEIINVENKNYDSIWGTNETPLNASNIAEIKQLEAQIIIASIIDFISKIEQNRRDCYENRKNM